MTSAEEVELSISIDDFKNYLSEKGVKEHCEVCGASSWDYINQTDNGRTLGIPVIDFKGEQQANINMSAMICNNCSHTRMFWRYRILHWKQQKAEEVSR